MRTSILLLFLGAVALAACYFPARRAAGTLLESSQCRRTQRLSPVI